MKRKKSEQEGFSETKSLLLATGVIFSLVLVQILQTTMISPQGEAVRTLPTSLPKEQAVQEEDGDFISTDEGTFSAWTVEKYFKEPMDEVIVLFASKKLPGLALVYYPQERKLVGGTPPMTAQEVHLFNGFTHHIAYSFKEGDIQQIYYDGQVKASSIYFPTQRGEFTGLVTGLQEGIQIEAFYNVTISSKELSQTGLTGFLE